MKCFSNLTATDGAIIIILGMALTLLRYVLTEYIFTPIGDRYQLSASVCETKLPESAWKFCFYFGSWSTVAYILLVTDENKYLIRPSSIWDNYSIDMVVPTSVYAVYIAQTSFYLHSVYATAFVDQWRRDSVVMIVHHFIALSLIVSSLCCKYHRFGITVFFLNDICDVLLEFFKITAYFKKQGKRTVPIFEYITGSGFICFFITWFVTRLYWFPLRLLYFGSVFVEEKQLTLPILPFINALLYSILAMNIYWYLFILNTLRKILTGHPTEDPRDYEEKEANDQDSEVNKGTEKKQK